MEAAATLTDTPRAGTRADEAKTIEGAVVQCARLRSKVEPKMGWIARIRVAIRVAMALGKQEANHQRKPCQGTTAVPGPIRQ